MELFRADKIEFSFVIVSLPSADFTSVLHVNDFLDAISRQSNERRLIKSVRIDGNVTSIFVCFKSSRENLFIDELSQHS